MSNWLSDKEKGFWLPDLFHPSLLVMLTDLHVSFIEPEIAEGPHG